MTPHLFGFSLANTNLRNGVFNALGQIGVKADLVFGTSLGASFLTQISSTQTEKIVETMYAMDLAGLTRPPLLTTNIPYPSYVSFPRSVDAVWLPMAVCSQWPVPVGSAQWQSYMENNIRPIGGDTRDDVNPATPIDWDLLMRHDDDAQRSK